MRRIALGYYGASLLLVLAGFLLVGLPVTAQDGAKKKPTETEKAVQGLREQTRKTNLKLMIQGQYSCCIAPGCSFCTLALGHCPCVKRLAQGQTVCHTCKGGWDAGHGGMPGVKPESVKAFDGAQLKKVFDQRKKNMRRKKRK